MPGFLYYVPKQCNWTAADLEAAGLAYAFDGLPTTADCTRGPAGEVPGTVMVDACHREHQRVGYLQDQQTWRKVAGRDTWVGKYSSDRITPQDLARKHQLQGHLVTLADEQQWLCPVVRAWSEEDDAARWVEALPRYLDRDDDGNWVSGDVLEKYARLWGAATTWHDHYLGQTGGASGDVSVDVKLKDVWDWSCVALAVNYRIDPSSGIELLMLKALTTDVYAEILGALIDLPTRRDWFQKKITEATAG